MAVGGVLGAEARYGIGLLLPHSRGAFPWSTVLINGVGCLAIGALMVLLLELTSPHRLARPLLGVGVLGGFTTFSTFAVDAIQLALAGRPLVALGYLGLTVAVCLAGVFAGTALTQRAGEHLVAARVRHRAERVLR